MGDKKNGDAAIKREQRVHLDMIMRSATIPMSATLLLIPQ
jgi:hypothetical protein